MQERACDVETYKNKLKNISNSYNWKKKKRLANAVHFSEWVRWVVEFQSNEWPSRKLLIL